MGSLHLHSLHVKTLLAVKLAGYLRLLTYKEIRNLCHDSAQISALSRHIVRFFYVIKQRMIAKEPAIRLGLFSTEKHQRIRRYPYFDILLEYGILINRFNIFGLG